MSPSSLVRDTSSFDPAIHLHSDRPSSHASPPVVSFSDEAQLLQEQELEVAAEKTKQGTVVRYRSWKVSDLFLNTPSRAPLQQENSAASSQMLQHQKTPPSSPPLVPFMSSPVAYPSSSPPPARPPIRKRKNSHDRAPLRGIHGNKRPKLLAGFVADDSDEEIESGDSTLATFGKLRGHKSAPAAIIPVLTPPTEHSEPDVYEGQSAAFINARIPPVAEDSDSINANYFYVPPLSPEVPQLSKRALIVKTCSGKSLAVGIKKASAVVPYEQLVAARSTVAPGKARKSYYGIDIHQLIDDAAGEEKLAEELAKDAPVDLGEDTATRVTTETAPKPRKTLMWTEKYRARKFTDLIGDERTHRSVLKWLKAWDPIVFPGSTRAKPRVNKTFDGQELDERPHRKILMLTGPPGLGKTTLAHVCARQAGYEVQEINASDERSPTVVKGRIRDMVGTENVKGIDTKTGTGKVRKAGRPVCVVVDEVDGVVGGGGGSGEGGFIKALVDLVTLDQKNASTTGMQKNTAPRTKRKGDNFRLLRPLILVCNDVYHPSLRPLRHSGIAEIIHMRKPPLSVVITRIQVIFEKERIACDGDGVRRLCEAAWGVSNRKEAGLGSGTGEGDIRGIMVVAEWVAGKLRASGSNETVKLTRRWVEENVLNDLAHGGGASRGIGRGGHKEIVERVFKEGAGFPKTAATAQAAKQKSFDPVITGVKGVAEASKQRALGRLREMIETSGDEDRIVTDCFTTFPSQPFQDDTFLSKPDAAYDWLHFHDSLHSAVYSSQAWEMMPYLSQPILAFHHLFASPASSRWSQDQTENPYSKQKNLTTISSAQPPDEQDPSPFTGPQASYLAHEATKQNLSLLQSLQSTLSLPLTRSFTSPSHLATDLLPYILRMLSPAVKPTVVGGSGTDRATASVRKASERLLVARAVEAMFAAGVRYERSRVESAEFDGAVAPAQGAAAWVYRMVPALDEFGCYESGGKGFGADGGGAKVRFAVRMVLDREWKAEGVRREEGARRARYLNGREEEGEDGEAAVADKAVGGKQEVGQSDAHTKRKKAAAVKRDFFGRTVADRPTSSAVVPPTKLAPGEEAQRSTTQKQQQQQQEEKEKEEGEGGGGVGRVWVSFHEGFSNAVRKPLTLAELMRGV
ncbi:Chromosome transmission fidelity protein 18 [Elasticomyces elasticus]|nr:Chromosome transmission fidelity protein 18 [Elasticomyces elasticus]